MTALVVDDHAEIRKMIAKILIGGGFDVIAQAADGAQAIEIAARLIPDIVTLDISIPVMSGLEALPRLREALPGAVIAMLTMDRQYVDQARRAGADLYILKNRAVQDLIPSLHAVCKNPARALGDSETGTLAGLQARVDSARRRCDACRREAREASDLALDLQRHATISSDGTFAAARAARLQKEANAALREYLDALAELRRFRERRTSRSG